jgi:hypothetical protein
MPAQTVPQKIKAISKLPMYLSHLSVDSNFRASANRNNYRAYTLIDNEGFMQMITVLGVVAYSDLVSKDAVLTISLEAEFAKTEKILHWQSTLAHLASSGPIATGEDFHDACRGGRMRFVRKPGDNSIMDKLDIVDFHGKDLQPDQVSCGDLVAVDFGLQVYSLTNPKGTTRGARLVLQSVQVIQPKYDKSFEREEKVEPPATPSPAKRRKFDV